MTRLEKLEREIQRLGPEELATLRDWFRKYDSEAWDRQIEEDASEGRFDKLAEEALAAHKARRTKELWSISPRPPSGNVTNDFQQTSRNKLTGALNS